MKTSPKDVSNNVILREFKKLSDSVTGQISGLKTEIVGLKTEVGGIKTEIVGLKTEVGGIKTEIVGLKTEVGGIKTEIVGLKTEVGGIKTDLGELKRDVGETMEAVYELSKHTDEGFSRLNTRVIRLESLMVTKDYLDDKLADLRSDITAQTRKEIEKSLR